MAIKQTKELEAILLQAADQGGITDIHLVAGEPVTYRRNGKLTRTEGEPLKEDVIRDIAVAAVGEDAVNRIGEKIGAMRSRCAVPGVIDARMTIARTMGELSIVMRVMIGTMNLEISRYGLPDALVKEVEKPAGLVILSGPVGSGKYTTALVLLDHLNATLPCHIATVEATPVVTLQPKQAMVQQREIGTDVPDLVSGVDAAMRQDVDVIFIGEVSSVEDVDAAMAAVAHGLLVMINLHASTADEAIERLIDIHAPEAQAAFRKMLAGNLRCSLAQRLFKRKNGKGRLAAFDLLIPDDNVREVIKTGGNISETRRGPGSIMIKDHIQDLVQHGKLSQAAVDEVLAWE